VPVSPRCAAVSSAKKDVNAAPTAANASPIAAKPHTWNDTHCARGGELERNGMNGRDAMEGEK